MVNILKNHRVGFFFFLSVSAASLSFFLKALFKRQYGTSMWPLVGWFTDYFCMNTLIHSFSLYLQLQVMGIISFVLGANTVQWECCIFHIRWIPLEYLPSYLFLTLFFFPSFWSNILIFLKTFSTLRNHQRKMIFKMPQVIETQYKTPTGDRVLFKYL